MKPANYDMKYHPMDSLLRAQASAKRDVRFRDVKSLKEDKAMQELYEDSGIFFSVGLSPPQKSKQDAFKASKVTQLPTEQVRPTTHVAHAQDERLIDLSASLKESKGSQGKRSRSSRGPFLHKNRRADSTIDPDNALFNEPSTTLEPFADLMTKDEVSELLNEHVEMLPKNHWSAANSAPDPQQTFQVVIYKCTSVAKRPITPPVEQTQERISKKKRLIGTDAGFTVHEDQANTTPLIQTSAFSISIVPLCTLLRHGLTSSEHKRIRFRSKQ